MEDQLLIGIISSTIFVAIAISVTLILILKHYKTLAKAKEKLFQGILEAQEEDRNRIARDIHDTLGALLNNAKLSLSEVKDEKLNEEAKNNIGKTFDFVLQAIEETRNAVNALRPEAIKRFGLKGAINDLKKKYDSQFEIELINNCPDGLNDLLQQHIYRILSELFNNTIKYSEATKIELEIFNNDEMLFIHYSDNGKGFDFDAELKTGKGNGLRNIKNRIDFMNGKIEVTNNQGITYELSFNLNKFTQYNLNE